MADGHKFAAIPMSLVVTAMEELKSEIGLATTSSPKRYALKRQLPAGSLARGPPYR